jgi:elongator complex protein 3
MTRPRSQQFNYQLDPSVAHDDTAWRERQQQVAIAGHEAALVAMIEELAAQSPLTSKTYHQTMREYARRGVPWLSKAKLLQAYEELCARGFLVYDEAWRTHLQMKPVRSQAGVTVVTVLTKPYACPGKCIFCPTDVRMPKSYLHDEPGAQRAERYAFDPYEQTAGRIRALEKIGHTAEKIELLILGGTWSSYPRAYQEWFVKRCFDALNGVEAESLLAAQEINSTAVRRNVGLVVETRQDHLNPDELRWLRYLGVTKVQVGIQSMDERVLASEQTGA